METLPVKLSPAQQGEQTRRTILDAAVTCASQHGLEGLTIGHLAKETGMSKSGLFAHFGSKEDLQMATIDAAHRQFVKEVIEPAVSRTEGGLPRLLALIDEWLRFIERRVLPCGCFFAQCALEFDSRPGRIKDRIATLIHSWVDLMESELRRAKMKHLLKPEADTAQVAFRLDAYMNLANLHWQIWDKQETFVRARQAIEEVLWEATTKEGEVILKERGWRPLEGA